MLIEAATLSFILAASTSRCGEGDSVLSIHSWHGQIVDRSPQEPKLLSSRTLEDAVASDLGVLPEISYILVERAEDNLLVWIAVQNPTKEVREKIFKKQYGLIEGFPEISFDFNIVIAKSHSPKEVASDAKLIYSRQG